MPEAAVAEPPVVEKPPAEPKEDKRPFGQRAGDRFRAEFDKLQKANEPAAPVEEPPTPPAKEESKPVVDVKVDPLAVAAGEVKSEEPPKEDENAWEKEDVVKEFDPQKANWQNARKTMGNQSLSIKKLTAEIESLKAGVAKSDPNAVTELQQARAELEQAKAKIAEQEQSIKAVGAEYSDEYKGLVSKHENATSKAVRRFESFAGKGTGDALADALSMPQGKMRTDAIKAVLANEALDADDRMEVRALISNVDSAVEAIEDFRKDLPARFDEITRQRDEQARVQSEQSAKELESNFGKVVADLPANNVFLRPISDSIPGASEWNGAIRRAQDTALSHLKPGQSFESSAELLVKGADYDRVVKYALDMRKTNSELQARLDDIDKAAPDFKGTSKKAPEEKKTGGQKYREYMDAHAAGNQME